MTDGSILRRQQHLDFDGSNDRRASWQDCRKHILIGVGREGINVRSVKLTAAVDVNKDRHCFKNGEFHLRTVRAQLNESTFATWFSTDWCVYVHIQTVLAASAASIAICTQSWCVSSEDGKIVLIISTTYHQWFLGCRSLGIQLRLRLCHQLRVSHVFY